LKAAIPYEYKPGLETYTTAAEIWMALEQRYASTSREDEWISINPKWTRSINTSKSTAQFSHRFLLNSFLNVASTMPKSTATSFALSRIQTFLAKTGRVSLPSSAKPGSQPQKNNCTRTRARTTTRISNRISRSPSP